MPPLSTLVYSPADPRVSSSGHVARRDEQQGGGAPGYPDDDTAAVAVVGRKPQLRHLETAHPRGCSRCRSTASPRRKSVAAMEKVLACHSPTGHFHRPSISSRDARARARSLARAAISRALFRHFKCLYENGDIARRRKSSPTAVPASRDADPSGPIIGIVEACTGHARDQRHLTRSALHSRRQASRIITAQFERSNDDGKAIILTNRVKTVSKVSRDTSDEFIDINRAGSNFSSFPSLIRHVRVDLQSHLYNPITCANWTARFCTCVRVCGMQAFNFERAAQRS